MNLADELNEKAKEIALHSFMNTIKPKLGHSFELNMGEYSKPEELVSASIATFLFRFKCAKCNLSIGKLALDGIYFYGDKHSHRLIVFNEFINAVNENVCEEVVMDSALR